MVDESLRKGYYVDMNVKKTVLKILQENQGKKVGGAELAEIAGASRNAVWKAINALEADGHDIERSHNGYVLNENLSANGIAKYYRYPGASIIVKESVGSTNSEMKVLAAGGVADRSMVVSDMQTEGRGRYGRKFYSEKGTGVYFSILVRNVDFERGRYLTAMAAVAAAESVESVFSVEAKIKWVNDIYVGGRKCVGILTESVTDMESGVINYAVVGIGINMKKPAGGYPEEIRDIAGVPSETLPSDAFNRIVAETANVFFGLYDDFDKKTLAEKYRSGSFLAGRTVNVIVNGEKAYEAVVKGIGDELGLIVIANGKEITLNCGEVSVHP